jgi:acyl-CoA thioesterase FadM
VFGIAVELALVVHDHIEVTFEEGGRSWWIYHIGFARTFARPGASIVVIFSIEVVHHRILSVDQFVDVGHEVTNGVRVSFVDFFEQLDVGDPLLLISDDVFVFDTWRVLQFSK